MAQAHEAVKRHARHIVEDVAECIEMCLKLNEQ